MLSLGISYRSLVSNVTSLFDLLSASSHDLGLLL